jgi:hypothetical protein
MGTFYIVIRDAFLLTGASFFFERICPTSFCVTVRHIYLPLLSRMLPEENYAVRKFVGSRVSCMPRGSHDLKESPKLF